MKASPDTPQSMRSNPRLLVVTDAWHPQTNGVVRTLSTVTERLQASGMNVNVLHPGEFKTWPLPSYAEIRFARNPLRINQKIDAIAPDAIHIATEGPLGLAARHYCVQRNFAFTTSLHTKFPEYVNVRAGLPLSVGYRFMRWFHQPAATTLVTTHSHRDELERWGMQHLNVWGRGVDTQLFQPEPTFQPDRAPRLLYVGRVAVEKNLESFLSADVPGEKIIVGDGPARADLQARFPHAIWKGYRKGAALVNEYANADVFVFPSTTDTFGLVMLEAMACGTPVAAFPVTGPIDVVQPGVNGALDMDLGRAIQAALSIDRAACRAYACANDWEAVVERFRDCLVQRAGTPLIAQADTVADLETPWPTTHHAA